MSGKYVFVGSADLAAILLSAADIPYVIADRHISALEAGIAAFPRRVMVRGYFSARARLDEEGQLYND